MHTVEPHTKEPVMSEGITWVGLDAHKSFIQVAVDVPGKSQLVEWRTEHTKTKVKKLARRLEKLAAGGEIRSCYEAGPCGWALKRLLEDSAPIVCEVIAPSLIPVKRGDRVKTDRKDARKLVEYLKAGMLTEVAPPSEEQEAARDLVRLREVASQDQLRGRHRLNKFLIRRHKYYPGKNWGVEHGKWLCGLRFEDEITQSVFDDLHAEVLHQTQRKELLVTKLEELACREPFVEPVGWLRCFHGIDTVTAITIVAELYDFQRFDSPRKLMSYLGLTPSEYTSGEAKRGGITKAGNKRVRRVLVESAHHYRHPYRVRAALQRRREQQPEAVIAVADRAHRRLNKVFWRQMNKGKHRHVAVTATAREMAGFIWSVLHPTAGVMADR